jgi:fucose permease
MTARQAGSFSLLVLSYVGFVSLGLPDTVLGAAWPAVRAEFGLPVDAAGAALMVTTGGVVISSLGNLRFRRRWGTGAVLVCSTSLAALALLGSSAALSFKHMLLAALVAGLGGGAIDASLNDYMARHHSARQMNWLHACWGVGASIAPAVVAAVLARGASWRLAYGLIGAVELLLILAFWQTRRSWNIDDTPAPAAEGGGEAGAGSRWARRSSVLMFFSYGGLEAGAGLWAASLLGETRGTSRALAGAGVAAYWGALCVGRFLIGVKADRWGPARVLRASVLCALLASIALAIPGTSAWFVIGCLICLGVALASIYPLAMHDTPRRFGSTAGARLVGQQVAAGSLGVATLPWLLGTIAASSSLTILPGLLCVLALCTVSLELARSRA